MGRTSRSIKDLEESTRVLRSKATEKEDRKRYQSPEAASDEDNLSTSSSSTIEIRPKRIRQEIIQSRTRRQPRRLTEKRQKTFIKFLWDSYCNPNQFGEHGSSVWMGHLIRRMEERKRDDFRDTDILNWMHSEVYEEAMQEIRSSYESSKSSSDSGIDQNDHDAVKRESSQTEIKEGETKNNDAPAIKSETIENYNPFRDLLLTTMKPNREDIKFPVKEEVSAPEESNSPHRDTKVCSTPSLDSAPCSSCVPPESASNIPNEGPVKSDLNNAAFQSELMTSDSEDEHMDTRDGTSSQDVTSEFLTGLDLSERRPPTPSTDPIEVDRLTPIDKKFQQISPQATLQMQVRSLQETIEEIRNRARDGVEQQPRIKLDECHLAASLLEKLVNN